MTFFSNVAPRRKVKPKPERWRCECQDGLHWRQAYITRCSVCGAERP